VQRLSCHKQQQPTLRRSPDKAFQYSRNIAEETSTRHAIAITALFRLDETRASRDRSRISQPTFVISLKILPTENAVKESLKRVLICDRKSFTQLDFSPKRLEMRQICSADGKVLDNFVITRA
jgi:hypothetical protein